MAKKLSAYNRHMSREMKKGKTFKQAVASWRPKRKSKSRAPARATRRSRPRTNKRKNPKMSKRRGFLSTSTFYKFARLAAMVGPAALVAVGPGDAPSKIKEGLRIYTGLDSNTGQWSLANLAQGWMPFIGTSLVTHGISKLNGIIRRL